MLLPLLPNRKRVKGKKGEGCTTKVQEWDWIVESQSGGIWKIDEINSKDLRTLDEREKEKGGWDFDDLTINLLSEMKWGEMVKE